MNFITVDIADFRDNLSDYLTMVRLGKAIVSVRNGKSGKEIVRIVAPEGENLLIEKRVKELICLAGFSAGFSNNSRKKFARMEADYINKLKKKIIE